MKHKYLLPAAALAVSAACSKSESASTADTSAGPSVPDSSTQTTQRRGNAVRGRLVNVSDTLLTVESFAGQVQVHVTPPLEVYARVPAKLSDVKASSFVGVTSVPQGNGSLQATEIHIFPDKLRGTNEGSFLMGQRGGGAPGAQAAGNRMTNGTVSGVNTGGGSGNRMTNGTVAGQSGNAITVRFQTDSQVIEIPANVTVTAIAPTQTKLAPGMNVVIQATRSPDGTLTASTVMLSPARAGR